MIRTDDTALVLVDVQEKLVPAMHAKESFIENLKILVSGGQILGIPIIWTEQNPKGLGATIPEIAELLPNQQPISKFSFSCCGSDQFVKGLKTIGRQNLLIAGIESHVCVYQTAADLIGRHYHVQVVADAVSSRTPENMQIGFAKSKDAGASLTSTETALFELLKKAEGAEFKAIIKLVK